MSSVANSSYLNILVLLLNPIYSFQKNSINVILKKYNKIFE